MSIYPVKSVHAAASQQDRVSREALEQLLSIRGEGDEWDFKKSLGNLSNTSVRVNLAKDVLALCNLPAGGALVIGVDDDYTRIGIATAESIDTTAIRNAVEKYIDGDFIVLAAEHLFDEGEVDIPKRYGIIYARRRSSQPVLAAVDGHVSDEKKPLFRSGDILIRRGAASIRANSGDVRRLLTSSVVHEAKVRSVNELWRIVLEHRKLLSGIEFLYDILADNEYGEVVTKPELSAARSEITLSEHASKIDDLQQQASLLRPHIPDELYQQYRLSAAFVGRIQYKAIRQRDTGTFISWTDLGDGSPDLTLRSMASQLLPPDELDAVWTGEATNVGIRRPLRPAIDAAERGLLVIIDRVLTGLA